MFLHGTCRRVLRILHTTRATSRGSRGGGRERRRWWGGREFHCLSVGRTPLCRTARQQMGSPLHGFECATTTFAYVLGHGSGASCGGRGGEGRGVVGGGGEIRVETEANGVMPSGLRSPRKRRRWCRSRIEVVLEKDGARQG
jgi:hypothetical protein